MGKNRFKELDAMRGIAALMVVFFHFTLGRSDYNSFFKLGTTGVDLFFIISGFVIFMSLQNITYSREFIINRVSRLYPTYWASVTFVFLLLVASTLFKGKFPGTDLVITYLGNMTMFQYYLQLTDLEHQYWTLIIEMLFYISILILFHFALLKYLNIICVALCLIAVILTNLFHEYPFVKPLFDWFPLMQFIPLFFAGTVFYKIYTGNPNHLLNYFLVFFCLACQWLLFPYTGRSKGFITHVEYTAMLFFFFTLFLCFVNNRLGFIVNKTTLFLGKISYALYLTHQVISVKGILPFLVDRMQLNFWVAALLVDLPIVIALAAFITYKIEVPYSRKMKEKLRKAWHLAN